MATTFTTTINSMYTIDTPEPGFVCNVLWTVTGVDGTYTAEIIILRDIRAKLSFDVVEG